MKPLHFWAVRVHGRTYRGESSTYMQSSIHAGYFPPCKTKDGLVGKPFLMAVWILLIKIVRLLYCF